MIGRRRTKGTSRRITHGVQARLAIAHLEGIPPCSNAWDGGDRTPNGVECERESIVLVERRTSGAHHKTPLCDPRTREAVLRLSTHSAAAPGIVRLCHLIWPCMRVRTLMIDGDEKVSTATMALGREPPAGYSRFSFVLRRRPTRSPSCKRLVITEEMI